MMEDTKLLGAIESLVREAFGDVKVTRVRQIRPWTVARCELERNGDVMTVVTKWLRSNPENFRVERSQVLTEAAALKMTNELVPGLAPTLHAQDLDHDLLLIEDLTPRRTLHSMLSGGLSETGVAGLHTFAETMARLHAATATSRRHGPWDSSARVPISRTAAGALLDRLDAPAPAQGAVRRDIDVAIATIAEPGPFHAFSNGDSGANNCLVTAEGGDGRLIDFEHACYRHALLDAAALHVPGSMWMTVADPVRLGVEDAYRRVAAEGMSAALDDKSYEVGLISACSLRALSKMLRFDKLDARDAGHHSRRQLVTTIERAVKTGERWNRLPDLTGWLADVAAALRRRWPDANVEFPDDYTLREPFNPDH